MGFSCEVSFSGCVDPCWGLKRSDCRARVRFGLGSTCQESFHKMDDMLRDPSFAKDVPEKPGFPRPTVENQ